MRIFLLVVTLLISLPSLVLACSIGPTPSDSLEPVTIKIADTYFKIPEGYIEHSFLRVPMERKYLGLQVPLGIIFPELANPDDKYRMLSIGIFSSTQEIRRSTIQLSDDIKISFGEMDPQERRDLDGDKVIKYLKSISSKEEPESWKKDTEIAKKFQLGGDPCEELMNRGSEKKSPEINYHDILEGIYHRNESIREAAAYKIAKFYKGNEKNTLEIIQDIIKNDKSIYVRNAAVRNLIKIAEYNDELIPQIIDIMVNDKNELVRKTVSQELPKIGNKSVELLIPLIKVGGEENYKNIGDVLAGIVHLEIYNNKYTSYKQLSPQSLTALNGIINILNNTKAEKTIESLLGTLSNSESAIATEGLVATLNKLVVEGKGSSAGSAAITLSYLGEAGYPSIPLIIKRMRNSNNAKELSRFAQSFQHFKEHGKAAIPALIKLSTYKKEEPETSYDPEIIPTWMVRLDALTALQFMGIKTPEIKAAFKAGTKDNASMVRSQSEAALKEF